MKKSLLVLFVMIITASCFVLTGCGGSDGGGSAATDGNEEAKWFDTDEGLRVQGTDSDTDLKLTDTEDGNLEFSVVGFHIIFEKQ